MDEATQRLVEKYGLDKQARQMHRQVTQRIFTKGLCEDIEKENRSYLAKFLNENVYSATYDGIGKSHAECDQWFCNREEAKIDYLRNMLETWNLKEKNKTKVAGLAAYILVHSPCRRSFTKGLSAETFLEPVYGSETTQEIIKEWKHQIDYLFDKYNDI